MFRIFAMVMAAIMVMALCVIGIINFVIILKRNAVIDILNHVDNLIRLSDDTRTVTSALTDSLEEIRSLTHTLNELAILDKKRYEKSDEELKKELGVKFGDE